jgi:hypothetical protein
MAFFKNLWLLLWNLLDRLLCVAFALAFTQVPTYIQQYLDTLDEVRSRAQTTYVELDARAAQYDFTVERYLHEQENLPDSARLENPELMKDAVARYQEYDAHYRSIAEVSPWRQPFAFLANYDRSIRASVQYKPAVPISWVGAVYAFLGVLTAMGLIGLVMFVLNRIRKRFNKPKPVYDPYKYRKKDVS